MPPLSIRIHYRLAGRSAWHVRDFTPDEYLGLDEGEIPEIDSVPRHAHACDALGIAPRQLAETRLVLKDAAHSCQRSIWELFWAEGASRFIEVRDETPAAVSREFIIDAESAPGRAHVLRMTDEPDTLKLLFYAEIECQPDGAEVECRHFPVADHPPM